ncbi:MAG: aldo/keto reductase [Promethearchaeota archaeon]|jgi:L-galactose dehydrogenase/L-glyceraldehyde 3-phosphate reductase
MKYRALGNTGLNVSEVGFGCGNVGGLMIRGSYEEQIEAMELALSFGINYFDTAPSYGDGRSETNLGKVLSELDPDILLASKVGLSLEQLDDIPDAIERSVEVSLDRLQRDYVDVLQLHSRIALSRDSSEWPRSLSISDVLGEKGVAETFDGLRRQGKTRFIGFTGLGETSALHKVIESRRFDVVQAYFNLLNPSAGYQIPDSFTGYDFKRLINKSNDLGLGIVAIRVMAAGAVGGESSRKGYAAPLVRGPMVLGGEYEKDQSRSSRLDFLVQGEIRCLPQAALKFVLMHQGVSTALVGFSNLNQIKEAAETTDFSPLSQSKMDKLQDLWSQSNW